MVKMTTGGGNKPLTKEQQFENIRALCSELNIENIKLKEEVKKFKIEISNKDILDIADEYFDNNFNTQGGFKKLREFGNIESSKLTKIFCDAYLLGQKKR